MSAASASASLLRQILTLSAHKIMRVHVNKNLYIRQNHDQ